MTIEVQQREFTGRDFTEVDFQEIHDIIFPADVRETDLITARLRKRGTDAFQPHRVWKLSPLGVELLPPQEVTFGKGELVDLEITVGRQTSRFDGLVVDLSPSDNQRRVLGVRFSAKKDDAISVLADRRRGSRWICSSQFDPVCIAPNPAQFNDFLYLKIRDISGTGIRAITSLRNKFIVPGMELSLQISFPMTSQVSIVMKVARLGITAEGGKDFLEVGLEFTTLSQRNREVIGQYLVQFSDADSLDRIRKEGFFPLSLTKGVDYQYIKSEAEFMEVLELRLAANQAIGKIPSDYTAADMADIYDTRGRIIVGKYRGRIVGTARLTFTEVGETLEHEQWVKLPAGFPRREQILEVSRAATNPEFRGSDLWSTLMQHIAIVTIQAKRNWVMISTAPELAGMYTRLGFKDTGLSYSHELYSGKTHQILMINVSEAISGIGVGPIYWNVIWRGVAKYLSGYEVLTWSNSGASRAKIYSMLAPFAEMLRVHARRPRKAKKQNS